MKNISLVSNSQNLQSVFGFQSERLRIFFFRRICKSWISIIQSP